MVLNVLHYWTTYLWQDFSDDTIRTKVVQFLHTIIENEQFHDLIPRVQSICLDLKEKPQNVIPPLVDEHRPLNLNVSITSFYPSSIVQNLNAIDANLWKQFSPTQSWDADKLNLLNSWSIRLSSLVKTRIFDGNTLGMRLTHLIRFMDICDELYLGKDNFTNYHSLISILEAISFFQKTILWKVLLIGNNVF
eukprot:TRINITY_DN260_c0_g1_i12.p2 TRINITY_DN260_c0_g1~~TRINITY_DN260_c0_g1_i12.p2  ORF type:complete len:192 (+),score=42.00 TRINITY_DN260_c0_g1_i12:1883-2458(+)